MGSSRWYFALRLRSISGEAGLRSLSNGPPGARCMSANASVLMTSSSGIANKMRRTKYIGHYLTAELPKRREKFSIVNLRGKRGKQTVPFQNQGVSRPATTVLSLPIFRRKLAAWQRNLPAQSEGRV